MEASIAVREQYLAQLRRLPALVEIGEVTDIEASGIEWYLRRAIRAETIQPIARKYVGRGRVGRERIGR